MSKDITIDEWRKRKEFVGFTDADAMLLKEIGPVVEKYAEEVVEVLFDKFMSTAPTKNGNIPPINRPMTTVGSVNRICKPPASVEGTACLNAENNANAVSAAEPMAKPLPIAAVVLPSESRLSVILRTSGPSPAISEIPPALSAIGP